MKTLMSVVHLPLPPLLNPLLLQPQYHNLQPLQPPLRVSSLHRAHKPHRLNYVKAPAWPHALPLPLPLLLLCPAHQPIRLHRHCVSSL